jgi:hypothetical protein
MKASLSRGRRDRSRDASAPSREHLTVETLDCFDEPRHDAERADDGAAGQVEEVDASTATSAMSR